MPIGSSSASEPSNQLFAGIGGTKPSQSNDSDVFEFLGGAGGGSSDPFASKPKADPFGQKADPFASSSDPFASKSDPFAAKADPFAANKPGFKPQADPFANAFDSGMNLGGSKQQ